MFIVLKAWYFRYLSYTLALIKNVTNYCTSFLTKRVKLYNVGITFLLDAILLSVGWKREVGLTQSLPPVCPYAIYTSDVPSRQHDEKLGILQYTVTFFLQDIAKVKIINLRDQTRNDSGNVLLEGKKEN